MEQLISRKTTKAYWEQSYSSKAMSETPKSPLQSIFDRFLPKNHEWTVIEIGACPGRNLAALALSHGYLPVALDYLPIVHQLKHNFHQYSIATVETINKDFFEWKTDRKFNVVISLGFIEHFADHVLVLKRHWALLKDGGYMVVGFPVFGPLQLLLRRLILTDDKMKEIMFTHNFSVMNVDKLDRTTRDLPGAKRIFSGHLGNMGTWFRSTDPYVRRRRRFILQFWKVIALGPRVANWSCHFFSPVGVLVFQKDRSLQ